MTVEVYADIVWLEQSLRWLMAPVTLTLKRAEGLYNTDRVGKLDPYVELRIGEERHWSKKHIDAGKPCFRMCKGG